LHEVRAKLATGKPTHYVTSGRMTNEKRGRDFNARQVASQRAPHSMLPGANLYVAKGTSTTQGLVTLLLCVSQAWAVRSMRRK